MMILEHIQAIYAKRLLIIFFLSSSAHFREDMLQSIYSTTTTSQKFASKSLCVLVPEVSNLMKKNHFELVQLLSLNLVHDAVAERSEASVSKVLILQYVGSNPGCGQKYECNFFYTDFFTFFFFELSSPYSNTQLKHGSMCVTPF